MNRIEIILLTQVLLLLICWFSTPSLEGVDFLALECTILGVSMTMIVFLLPQMSAFRTKLMKFDESITKSDIEQLKLLKNIYENTVKAAELCKSEEIQKRATDYAKMIHETVEKAKSRTPVSDIITNQFRGLESIAQCCICYVVLLVVLQ